jgi:tight adherence protein B
MTTSTIAALTFVVVLALIFGAYWLTVAEPEAQEQRRLKRRLRADNPAITRASATVQLLKQEAALSNIGPLNALLSAMGAAMNPLRMFIGNSGLPLTVGTFLLLTGVTFLSAALLVRWYFPIFWVILPVAASAAFLPYFAVSYFRSVRQHKFEEQFPEAIELIARAMRAGHAFTTGIKIAADELPEPAGPEFRLLYERQNYGAQMPDALRAFAERVPTIDARFFVTAVLTQREAGGNLSEILDRLAAVMRERFRIRQEVRTRSAHGRVTAYVLAAMPPVLAVLMLLLNPRQMMILATDPLGVKLVIAGIVLQVCGVLLVRKIVDIQY